MTHPDVHAALIALWCAQLKVARRLQRQAQRVVADRIGVSQSVLSRWEKGQSQPTLEHLMAWAEALGFELLLTPINDKEINA